MNVSNANASAIQVEVIEDSEELNIRLNENKDAKILNILYKSMIIIDEVVYRDCYLVIYK
ncbi:hypothetical protein ACWM35_10345 [Neobacillus sp. K501]